MASQKQPSTLTHKILSVVGIVLCVILIPIFVVNVTLLIKGFTNKKEVPSIGGIAPMIVLTDSMKGEAKDCFDGGDLIFVKSIDAKDVKKGDVITFFDPASSQNSVLSHRVVEVLEEDGKLYFKTKGDNNNTEDKTAPSEEDLIGKYTGFRIANAGHVAMFMQTTGGLIVCVLVPIILLVGYDAVRRAIYNKKHKQDKDELLAELEELRKLKAGGAEASETPAEETAKAEE